MPHLFGKFVTIYKLNNIYTNLEITNDPTLQNITVVSIQFSIRKEGRKEMFYLMTHSTHFIYGYMASYIW